MTAWSHLRAARMELAFIGMSVKCERVRGSQCTMQDGWGQRKPEDRMQTGCSPNPMEEMGRERKRTDLRLGESGHSVGQASGENSLPGLVCLPQEQNLREEFSAGGEPGVPPGNTNRGARQGRGQPVRGVLSTQLPLPGLE